MSILLYVEHDGTDVNEATLKAATAASQLASYLDNAEIHALVAGQNSQAVAEQAAKISGVSRVIHVDNAAYAHPLAENLTQLTKGLMDNYSALVAAATTTAKNFMPCVAALLDVMQISEIIKVNSANGFERPIYAGNAIQTLESSDDKLIITVRTTAFKTATLDGSASITAQDSAVNTASSTFVSAQLSSSDRPELASAKIVISGGRGMGSGENFALIEKVADKLGAAIGASRAAVDAGYVPNDYQVGQTGKVVAPDLYIAVGISGAIQHLAGMKDSKIIVAINKDEDAPIFQVADYGLVEDLFTALPELEQKL
ncbi:MAG: electron transfer flavoprotein subunit alpha/FixB family protein [Rhizobiales bacterium]|nr:electron transfer flavoprotein subunit alpha/FixB family protein [Hyphomicrobiales bacterium]